MGCSKNKRIVESATPSVQCVIRTIRSSLEERWRRKGEDWRRAFHLAVDRRARRIPVVEVGDHHGKTACERFKGMSAKVQGAMFAVGMLWKRRRARGALEKPRACGRTACAWSVKATTGEFTVREKRGI